LRVTFVRVINERKRDLCVIEFIVKCVIASVILQKLKIRVIKALQCQKIMDSLIESVIELDEENVCV